MVAQAATVRMPLSSAVLVQPNPPKGGYWLGSNGCRLGVLAASSLLDPGEDQDLERARDGDRSQGADHAGQLGADEHGDQDRKGDICTVRL